ncbi:uncharacterized protein LOC62_02G001959 [Vanrija pseudolonga]|uniref:Zn(2)-C6 fungal-type domain-containing protein n=1 Tax=Vanrija pseudolonga TaxID=143232 RepID=A0AAF0Y1V8_9TREE|nr:hypothetical protein LOC62_02G001959 [Vanrija pseudolonga]
MTRGKKCDEIWSPEGYCQRCLAGPWECSGRTSMPGRPAFTLSKSPTAGVDDAASTLSGLSSLAAAAGAGIASVSPPAPMAARPTSARQPIASSPATSISVGSVSSVSSRTPLPNQPVPLPAAAPFPPTPSDSNGVTPFALWNGLVPPADATRPLFTTPFSQPLFDWPDGNGPTAVLTTTADGTLAIDASTEPLGGVSSAVEEFWNSLSASFNPQAGSSGAGSFNTGSRVLFLSSDRPMRQGVSLAEIYARVVDSWLVGLTEHKRDYARARILALNDTNSVMRAVRYAVAAAYIFLFASGPEGHKDRRPKLVELACKGAGIPEDLMGASAAESGDTTAATKKITLYVDHVSTPFASDLESAKWTEDAIHELRNIQITKQSELSDLLWGVIDLQLVEFIRGGAAPSYSMLALGDRLVRSVFPGDHPSLSLWDLRTPETFSLRLYAISDLSRCIVQRGRRTIFNFYMDVRAHEPADEGDEEPWASPYLGMPDAIMTLLARVVNLCSELNTRSAASIKADADEIESDLRSWTPAPVSPHNVDSSALVTRTIAGEMWRLCTLIVLYQSVHRVGGLHTVLRRAGTEMLSLLSSITQFPSGDLWGFLALPAFLAACLSITDHDRKRAMSFLVRTGPERVWLDNIALVEKVWEETDETGRIVDWHDKLTREGLSVAFF